jgi:hypothetical protein
MAPAVRCLHGRPSDKPADSGQAGQQTPDPCPGGHPDTFEWTPRPVQMDTEPPSEWTPRPRPDGHCGRRADTGSDTAARAWPSLAASRGSAGGCWRSEQRSGSSAPARVGARLRRCDRAGVHDQTVRTGRVNVRHTGAVYPDTVDRDGWTLRTATAGHCARPVVEVLADELGPSLRWLPEASSRRETRASFLPALVSTGQSRRVLSSSITSTTTRSRLASIRRPPDRQPASAGSEQGRLKRASALDVDSVSSSLRRLFAQLRISFIASATAQGGAGARSEPSAGPRHDHGRPVPPLPPDRAQHSARAPPCCACPLRTPRPSGGGCPQSIADAALPDRGHHAVDRVRSTPVRARTAHRTRTPRPSPARQCGHYGRTADSTVGHRGAVRPVRWTLPVVRSSSQRTGVDGGDDREGPAHRETRAVRHHAAAAVRRGSRPRRTVRDPAVSMRTPRLSVADTADAAGRAPHALALDTAEHWGSPDFSEGRLPGAGR